jgi:Tfp pilus assembly protein PilO
MPPKEKKKDGANIAKYMPAIIAVVAVAYLLLAYFFLFMPKIGQFMAGGALDIRPLQARVADYEAYLLRITDAEDKFKQVHSDYLSKVPAILPDWEDTPNIYTQMDELARKNGMVLASIDTIVNEAPPGPNGLREVRVSVSLVGGGYKEFESFLAGLEKLVRVSDIDSLTFAAGDTSYSVIMKTYFIDPTVAPAQEVVAEPILLENL